jgi:hypothetical protein
MGGAMRIGLIVLPAMLAAAGPVAAQATPAAVPDPASIKTPDLSGGRDPAVARDGAKYYYFWRADTSYEQAYADFADCARFLPMAQGNAPLLPMFIAWRGASEDRDDTAAPAHQYGLVGDLIGSMIMGSATQLAAQSRLHVCLAPLGYRRFALPKATWQTIKADTSPEAIALRAKIASGPRPDAEPLAEVQ